MTAACDVRAQSSPAALAALAMGASASASAAARARGHPELRIVRTAPVTVAGTGFRNHERVRVSLRMTPRSASRTVTARVDGTFTARFAGGDGGPALDVPPNPLDRSSAVTFAPRPRS
jgi:hypothetical protein